MVKGTAKIVVGNVLGMGSARSDPVLGRGSARTDPLLGRGRAWTNPTLERGAPRPLLLGKDAARTSILVARKDGEGGRRGEVLN